MLNSFVSITLIRKGEVIMAADIISTIGDLVKWIIDKLINSKIIFE